jgi:hypothetical protein
MKTTICVVLTLARLALLLPLVTGQNATTGGVDDSQILAARQIFEITTGATFRCTDSGSRCVYHSEAFASVDARQGLTNVNTEGDVWAALDAASDTLIVGACTQPSFQPCYVKCNAYCTCTQPDGTTPCTISATKAPSPTPPTPAPVPQTCPSQQNTNLCSQLMNKVPSNNFFDCYNFCGGIFISSCAFSGKCGTLTCNNATASGVNGTIVGCTDADRVSTTSSSTTTSQWMGLVASALLAAIVA